MPFSRFMLHLPHQAINLPYIEGTPAVPQTRLPNGTLLGTDEARPELFYKFTPWQTSDLAFNEIALYSQLQQIGQHSGIVRMHGVSGTTQHLVRIMERAHRGTLDRILFSFTQANSQPLESHEIRRIITEIATAFAHLHTLNIVHRDIKAENILAFDTMDGPANTDVLSIVPKVADFDRAIHLPQGSFLEKPVGSLFHMAPELLRGERYDRKVDVYAFGILMFEIAHGGSRPYTNVATSMPGSITRDEFAAKVIDEDFRPAWKHPDNTLKQIAEQCWAAAPERRPTFSDILSMLGAAPFEDAQSGAVSGNADHKHTGLPAIGMTSDVGKERTGMEDASCVLTTQKHIIGGVFDGMGGSRTSTLAARQFILTLADRVKSQNTTNENAIRETLADIDKALRKEEPALECGSTAVVAVLDKNAITIGWLGDSSACRFRRPHGDDDVEIVDLVSKHHPKREDEEQRILATGGTIHRESRWLDNGEQIPSGPWRVYAPGKGRGVAVSRALGLFALKPAIGDEPETRRIERTDRDLFLVLGSDGVFDFLDTKKIYTIISKAESASAASEALIEAVLERGAPDNASVIVIDLQKAAL